VAILVFFNYPRLPWIPYEYGGPVGLFRGFAHGAIGFSYQTAWILTIGGIYQLILGIVYWDMDTSEAKRWQFAMETGTTAKLLWALGGGCAVAGIAYLIFVYTHDSYLWPCGIFSTLVSLVACWLFWLAFPLMEQIGIDREHFGV
jgi:hypothetical protein